MMPSMTHMVKKMSLARKAAPKARMSIYVSEENRKRLARIPKGLKTTLVNDALSQALTTMEKQDNFGNFLDAVREIKRVKISKSSEEMVRELRKTGSVILNP
jgi:hypothetical protein